jgi:hypothetical protein
MLKRNLIANYLGQGWNALMGLGLSPFTSSTGVTPIQRTGVKASGCIVYADR